MDERITRAIIGALRAQDRSGHELWKWLGPIHGAHEQLTEANLYPTLYRLEAAHVIRGEGREINPTRRAYRVAARGLELAAGRGWPAVPHRQDSDPVLTSEESAAIEWSTEPDVTGSAGTRPTVSSPVESEAAHAPSETAEEAEAILSAYVSEVDAGLRLSWPYRNSVRIEIGDHLQDSMAELVEHGLDPVAAATEATVRLGPPGVLAEAASAAQLTRSRLVQGIRGASYLALVSGGLGLAAGAAVLLAAPLVARFLVSVAATVGIHIYVPETVEWKDQQTLAAAWVGAFIASRRSTSRFAIRSARAEHDIRLAWAIGGAVPLALVALFWPIALDPLTVIGLAGIPAAFVIGAWHTQGPGDDSASKRGVAQAAVLLAVFLFLPGFRVWVFDAGSVPSTNPPRAQTSNLEFNWHDNLSGTSTWHIGVTGLDPAVWRDARIEFWRTARQGPIIGPDPGATQPAAAISPEDGLDISRLPNPTPDWWVTLTATGSDGQRRTLLSDLHVGASTTALDSLFGWILAHR
ncbi:MAG: helix-turn-helix transcriptional regulator [Candidatus Limnocylindrales bacterium]